MQQDNNINDFVKEKQRGLYIKIGIFVFVVFVIFIIAYYFLNKKSVAENPTPDKTFINIGDIPDRDNNTGNTPEQNNQNSEDSIENEDGLWQYYNIFADQNVVLSQNTDNGIFFLERNYISNLENKNKYTIKYIDKKNNTLAINIDLKFDDIIKSWSISSDNNYIFIVGKNKSALFKTSSSKDADNNTKYYIDQIGEIENIKSSATTNNYLYFTKSLNNDLFLYKLNYKNLKDQKLINIPVRDFDLQIINDNLYLYSKTYIGDKQLILKYNEKANIFENFANKNLEQKIFSDATLVNDGNKITLKYKNKTLDINIKTTLNKCGASEGYIYCAYSDNYKNLASWYNKENFYNDKIFIYDLINKNAYKIDIENHISRYLDIDNIFIKNNFLYFKDRNVGSFGNLDLKILEKI